jgi:hypothetical protein
MRIPTLAIFTVLTAAPAVAQTNGGNYPFCMELYLRGGSRNIECRFTSLAQCQATASGQAGSCSANPNYSNVRAPREPANRQPRRGY